jgi:hypothetical protein
MGMLGGHSADFVPLVAWLELKHDFSIIPESKGLILAYLFVAVSSF